MKSLYQKLTLVVGILCVLFLSGCEVRNPVGSKTFVVRAPLARQAELAKIKYWRINGAFSIQFDNRRHAEIANYSWWQSDHAYRIAIVSALDLYRVDIVRMNGVVKLWKNGTLSLTAHAPEELLQETMGWSLPISELRYWIIGMPASQKQGKFYVKYDRFGHLVGLKQMGWTLQYGSYKRQPDGLDYPQSITMKRPGLQVKIIVKERLLMMERYDAPSTTA